MRNDNVSPFGGRIPPKPAASPGKNFTRGLACDTAIERQPTLKKVVMDILWEKQRAMTPYEIWIEATKRGLQCKPKSIDPTCTRLHQQGHIYGTQTYGKGEGGQPAEKMWLTEQHRTSAGPIEAFYRRDNRARGLTPKRTKVGKFQAAMMRASNVTEIES